MFICPDCAEKRCDYCHFSGSVGPCELCGKHSVCHDCHHPLRPIEDKEKKDGEAS